MCIRDRGRYVTVRGAPKQYTTVSLDGVPLANPDGSSRGVELDTIPSDVIAALEVTKAITPDMDGDAIGGNINIRTQSALDRDGPTLRASTALGKFQLGDGDNQRHNATAGQRFGADNNIGVLFSGSYSKQGLSLIHIFSRLRSPPPRPTLVSVAISG